MNTKLWGLLAIVMAAISVPLYLAIDSKWATDNNMTILVTIAFFIASALAIVFAFNAVAPVESEEKDVLTGGKS